MSKISSKTTQGIAKDFFGGYPKGLEVDSKNAHGLGCMLGIRRTEELGESTKKIIHGQKSSVILSHTNLPHILLMEEILHQLIGS